MALTSKFKQFISVIVFLMVFPFAANADVFPDGGLQVWANGNVAYSNVVYGVVGKSGGNLGGGSGFAFGADGYLRYSVLGAKISDTYSTVGDIELTSNNIKTTQIGSGHVNILDLTLGLNLGADPGDQGYFYLYGGYRIASGAYDQEKIKVSGIETALKQSTEMSSTGLVFGLEDVTMFKVSTFQIGWIAGLAFSLAKPSEYTIDSTSYKLEDAAGFGVNVNAGLRLGMDKLYAQLQYKVDIGVGVAKAGGTDVITGLGVGGYFLSVGYYF
jgi:hypothetical protein